jgi:hypothetical protein
MSQNWGSPLTLYNEVADLRGNQTKIICRVSSFCEENDKINSTETNNQITDSIFLRKKLLMPDQKISRNYTSNMGGESRNKIQYADYFHIYMFLVLISFFQNCIALLSKVLE